MIKTPKKHILENPKLLDIPIKELTEAMELNLNWLDSAFGKIEKFTEKKGRETITYPAVPIQGKKGIEYLKVFPDSHIGNFSYCEIGQQSINHAPNQFFDFGFELGIVFWFDYRKLFQNSELNTIENVKDSILSFFNNYSFSTLKLRVKSIIEDVDEIYRGFSHREIENQFLMRPFGGFRINFDVKVAQKCGDYSGGVVQLPQNSGGNGGSQSEITLYSIAEKDTGLKYFDAPIFVRGFELSNATMTPSLSDPYLFEFDTGILVNLIYFVRGEASILSDTDGLVTENSKLFDFVIDATLKLSIQFQETEVQFSGMCFIYFTKDDR